MSTAIAPGALARLTQDSADLGSRGQTRKQGFTFEVEDYIPAEVSEDGRAFYYGSADGGVNNVTVYADVVEQVMSPEQTRARTVPTIDAIARALGSQMCGVTTDGFVTDETSQEGHGVVLIVGQTTEGLRFAAQVQVLAVAQADF